MLAELLTSVKMEQGSRILLFWVKTLLPCPNNEYVNLFKKTGNIQCNYNKYYNKVNNQFNIYLLVAILHPAFYQSSVPFRYYKFRNHVEQKHMVHFYHRTYHKYQSNSQKFHPFGASYYWLCHT